MHVHMHTTKYYQNQTLSVAIVSVLATPGVRRGGASVGVGVGVVGGDTVGYGGMGIRWDGIRWHWQEEDGSMGGLAM